ncbi:hypothetical protein BKD26_36950 [Streptomyces sp. CB03238]|nr:hypothetical protein BKD26_36950 [Streptomyces sp. CB03238]
MAPVNISCTEPTARTVVTISGQGQALYPGVVVDLVSDDAMLYIADEGPDRGQPYFTRRRIDLGGGLEPGGLRVEALVSDQSCKWEIRARYRDAQQNAGEVTLRDGDKPFFAEAVPDDPEQYWQSNDHTVVARGSAPTFLPCHEMPDEPICAFGAGGS